MPRELFDVVVGLQLCGLPTPLSPISHTKLYKYYNYNSNYYYYYYYYCYCYYKNNNNSSLKSYKNLIKTTHKTSVKYS